MATDCLQILEKYLCNLSLGFGVDFVLGVSQNRSQPSMPEQFDLRLTLVVLYLDFETN